MNETNQTDSSFLEELLNDPLQHPIVRLGEFDLSLLAILKILIFLALVVLAEILLRRYILQQALKRTRLEPSIQYGISRMLGYAFIAFGFYVVIVNFGIDLTSLAVFAGALGVGIGFGLQNVISNFMSGLIILMERPIAIGDRVEVGGVAGRVTRIALRSTTVVTNDNISIIVPNSDFISTPVTNWSHGDPKVRMRLPLGVAYGSDVEKLKRVLLEVAAAHPHVLKEPAPAVFFVGFGDSSLNFELGVWTSEMMYRPRGFISDLYFAIEKTLREHDIEIPFPQRDLHLRSGSVAVQPDGRLRFDRSGGEAKPAE